MQPTTGGSPDPKRLGDIIHSLDTAMRDRVVCALELIASQSLGAEAFRSSVEHWIKEDESPVTVADVLHQSQLQQLLAWRFGEDGLISEESAEDQERVFAKAGRISSDLYGIELEQPHHELPCKGEICWIYDPIDGTKGYLNGRYYAIALGFFVEGNPLFGAMAVPACIKGSRLRIDHSIAFAIRGLGAWIARIADFERLAFRPLHDPLTKRPERIRLAISLEHSGLNSAQLDQMEGLELARLDSQAKYLGVAAGDIEIYMRKRRDDGRPDQTWDHMPGGLIAQEAGGQVRHFNGHPVSYEPHEVITFEGGFSCTRPDPNGYLESTVNRLTEWMTRS